MDVLVICPDAYDAAAFAALRQHRIHLLPADVDHWRPSPRFDVLAYLEAGRRFLRRRRVDAVVSTHDLGDLIAAVRARAAIRDWTAGGCRDGSVKLSMAGLPGNVLV